MTQQFINQSLGIGAGISNDRAAVMGRGTPIPIIYGGDPWKMF